MVVGSIPTECAFFHSSVAGMSGTGIEDEDEFRVDCVVQGVFHVTDGFADPIRSAPDQKWGT